MNQIKMILIAVFFLNAVLFLYDAGKYSEGYTETRTGRKWQFYSLIQACVDFIIIGLVLSI